MSETMGGHPLHPAFTHFPISFLGLSYILDATYGAATHSSTAKLVASIYNITPYLGDIARFSHYLNILGLISAVPAILTGGQQLMVMMQKQDLATKFEKSQNKIETAQKMHPKMKIAFAHAAMNDISVAGSVYLWWIKKSAPGYAPTEMSIYVSIGLMTLLFTAGYLGAALVYDHGVGVSRQRDVKGQKEQ